MKEIFDKIQAEINIPCYFIARPQEVYDCIIYNYRQNIVYSDEKEESIEYNLFINLICTNDINNKIISLKNILMKYSFRNIFIGITIFSEEKNIYETVFNCKKNI